MATAPKVVKDDIRDLGFRWQRSFERIQRAKAEYEDALRECETLRQELMRGDPKVSLLTRREQQVYDLIQALKSNKEIGAALNLSERTVKFHVSSILSKFGGSSRMDLIGNKQVARMLALQ